jgi:hypothetical protein
MTTTGPGAIENNSYPSVSTFSILRGVFTLHLQLKKQERYLNNYLPVLLREIVPGCYETFTPTHIKRTIKYWQLSLNVICDNLYILTGKKLSSDEHNRIILLSVFGPLFDDLFDDHLLDHEQISSLVAKPEAYVPINATDQLVTKIYLELLHLTPHPHLLTKHMQELFHWQQASLKQLQNNITEEELYEITYNKSYYAVLLYCAVMNDYPNQELLEIIYPVAGLLQLTNDAFDVWKDVQKGVYTLPNLYRNFEQLKQQFLTETALINQKLWQLPYPTKNKQAFAITVHCLPAMGWMSLEQLQKATAGISDFEALRALSRQQLVCDMDSVSQKMKWLQNIRRFANHHAISSHTPSPSR